MAQGSPAADRSNTLHIWEPLIGRKAALSLYRGKWVVGTAKWVALTDFVLIFVVFHTMRSWAATVAWVAGIALVAFGCSSAVFLVQYHRAASKALGITEYLEWCQRNGVQPLTSR